MSASTRTVQQQTLGNNQLGAVLAVVALAIIVAAAIAFGSLSAPKAAPVPGQPAVVTQPGWTEAGAGKAKLEADRPSVGGSYVGPSSQDFGNGTSMGGWSGNRQTGGGGGPRPIAE